MSALPTVRAVGEGRDCLADPEAAFHKRTVVVQWWKRSRAHRGNTIGVQDRESSVSMSMIATSAGDTSDGQTRERVARARRALATSTAKVNEVSVADASRALCNRMSMSTSSASALVTANSKT